MNYFTYTEVEQTSILTVLLQTLQAWQALLRFWVFSGQFVYVMLTSWFWSSEWCLVTWCLWPGFGPLNAPCPFCFSEYYGSGLVKDTCQLCLSDYNGSGPLADDWQLRSSCYMVLVLWQMIDNSVHHAIKDLVLLQMIDNSVCQTIMVLVLWQMFINSICQTIMVLVLWQMFVNSICQTIMHGSGPGPLIDVCQ